jgi:hypothetical protein
MSDFKPRPRSSPQGLAGGEAGAAHLTTLPSDPREKVLACFPNLPAAGLTAKAVQRIAMLIDQRHDANELRRAEAEMYIKELDDLHQACVEAVWDARS